MEDQAQSLIDQTTAQMKINPQPSQMLIPQQQVVMPVTMVRGPGPMGGMNPAMMRPPMMGGRFVSGV